MHQFVCFRPLPRLIGSIPVTVPTKHDTLYQFSAPLEGDRDLYVKIPQFVADWIEFPAPHEVDRYLYKNRKNGESSMNEQVSGPYRGR